MKKKYNWNFIVKNILLMNGKYAVSPALSAGASCVVSTEDKEWLAYVDFFYTPSKNSEERMVIGTMKIYHLGQIEGAYHLLGNEAAT